MKKYLATFSIRGEATVLIQNCRSAKEAKTKLLEWEKDTNHPDVEMVDHGADTYFVRSAKVEVHSKKK